MEIDPGEVPVDLMVKVLFRLSKQLWRDGFSFNGETRIDIQTLQEAVFFHQIQVVAGLLKHSCLKVILGEAVDEFHLA